MVRAPANLNEQRGQLCIARERDTAVARQNLSSIDGAVVTLHELGASQHQRRTRVDNCGGRDLDLLCPGVPAANLEGRGVDLPVSARIVDRDLDQVTRELGGVDATKLVAANAALRFALEEHGHHWLVEVRQEVLEEGLLRDGLDGVERAECQTDQAIGEDILRQETGHVGSQTNGLAIDCGAAKVDSLESDNALGGRAVAVGDAEGAAL